MVERNPSASMSFFENGPNLNLLHQDIQMCSDSFTSSQANVYKAVYKLHTDVVLKKVSTKSIFWHHICA